MEERGHPLLVVFTSRDEHLRCGYRLYAVDDIAASVLSLPQESQEWMLATISELIQLSPETTEDVIDIQERLGELSVGPLRTAMTGRLDEVDEDAAVVEIGNLLSQRTMDLLGSAFAGSLVLLTPTLFLSLFEIQSVNSAQLRQRSS